MVFHEITREAIQQALADTREIDQNLVRAQETRRILDRLVGYTVSPLLWKKIAPQAFRRACPERGRAAAGAARTRAPRLPFGRVLGPESAAQQAAGSARSSLRGAVDLGGRHARGQRPRLRRIHGQDLRQGKNVLLLDQEQAASPARIGCWPGSGASIDSRRSSSNARPRRPSRPARSSKRPTASWVWARKQTMRVAQSLYENGYITYMRTDSVNLSDQAVNAARRRITRTLRRRLSDAQSRAATRPSPKARKKRTRPSARPGDQMLPVDRLPLDGQEARLYDLIWKRTVATQMAERPAASLRPPPSPWTTRVFRASGRTVLFPGFFRAYVEGSDDPDAALESQESPLPPLVEGEAVDCRELEAVGHETKPPARYTEATLVKALEAEGIGRPSTYATIIDTIQQRGYVFKQRKELVPDLYRLCRDQAHGGSLPRSGGPQVYGEHGAGAGRYRRRGRSIGWPISTTSIGRGRAGEPGADQGSRQSTRASSRRWRCRASMPRCGSVSSAPMWPAARTATG